MQKIKRFLTVCSFLAFYGCGIKNASLQPYSGITINTLTEEGAWCWFADHETTLQK